MNYHDFNFLGYTVTPNKTHTCPMCKAHTFPIKDIDILNKIKRVKKIKQDFLAFQCHDFSCKMVWLQTPYYGYYTSYNLIYNKLYEKDGISYYRLSTELGGHRNGKFHIQVDYEMPIIEIENPIKISDAQVFLP